MDWRDKPPMTERERRISQRMMDRIAAEAAEEEFAMPEWDESKFPSREEMTRILAEAAAEEYAEANQEEYPVQNNLTDTDAAFVTVPGLVDFLTTMACVVRRLPPEIERSFRDQLQASCSGRVQNARDLEVEDRTTILALQAGLERIFEELSDPHQPPEKSD